MNNDKAVSGKQHLAELIPSVFILISFFLSVIFFKKVSGSLDFEIVGFSIAIVFPEVVCVIVLCRMADRIRQPDIQPPEAEIGMLPVKEDTSSIVVEPEITAAVSAEKEYAAKVSTTVCDIASRTQLLCPVIDELCSSITQNLSSTTEPISAELLHIKQSSETFLTTISSYESDVKDKAAIIRLRNESDLFNNDLKSLSGTILDVFSTLDSHMADLKTVSGHIGEIAGDIGEISEQIRILSFNASIEAARAGAAGSGFRIIAGEIKRLSADTESRLSEIRKMLNETRTIFSNIATGLDQNKNKILDVVAQRQTGFSVFEQTLENYFPKLESLYTGVLGIINSLTKSMDVISPVVQLHEITSQEIGNLNRVTGDFCSYIGKKSEAACQDTAAAPDTGEVAAIVSEVRSRLTTESELHALERGIKKTVPDAKIDLAINTRGIELF
ncbi:MAG: methyl-accepting chemotaxis protein [Treponema sp.]|nr:methyl-accepting chemotaxis protein [Treponema sp.]